MLRPRLTFWLIILLAAIVAFLDFPKTNLKFEAGPAKVDLVLVHPQLDLTKIGLPIKRDLEPKLGLDLSGGTHLVLVADMSKIEQDARDDAAESARSIIERRVNLFGVTEPVIQTAKVADDYHIIVELPGVTDVGAALDLIGKTAQLDFREPAEATPSATLSAAVSDFKPTDLTGKDLSRAAVSFNPTTGEPEVSLKFTSEGAKKFEQITARNIGRQVGIFLDDQPVSAPVVQQTITGGNAVITGRFTLDVAKSLAISLNAGALPAPIKVAAQQNIGPTLGAASINKSLIAGGIGLGIVAAFMIFYYNIPGLLAVAALLLYTGIVFAILKLLPVTLTLASIAAFILSIGMAVDANILIFERMREEIRWGHTKAGAVEAGFVRAWSSIRDSNISSLITAAILFWFGTGLVRGFALTLAIGILVSMFSAITVTRTLLKTFLRV